MIENKEFVKECIEDNDLCNAVKYIIAEPRELFGDTSGTGLQEAVAYVMSIIPDKEWDADSLEKFVNDSDFERHVLGGVADWSC